MENRKTGGVAFSTGKQDRVRSPEELDAYIRVVKPGMLVLIGALALVVVALIVWGFTGTLPYSKTVNGVMFTELERLTVTILGNQKDGKQYDELMSSYKSLDEETLKEINETQVYLFLDAFEYGRDALVGQQFVVRYPGHSDITGTVVEVDAAPVTKEEIVKEFGSNWIAANCADSEFSWVVHGRIEQTDFLELGMVVDVTIVTDNVRPISFLLR